MLEMKPAGWYGESALLPAKAGRRRREAPDEGLHGGATDAASRSARRVCRTVAKPLIRPSGTFSPPARGEGKTLGIHIRGER